MHCLRNNAKSKQAKCDFTSLRHRHQSSASPSPATDVCTQLAGALKDTIISLAIGYKVEFMVSEWNRSTNYFIISELQSRQLTPELSVFSVFH